MYNNIKLLYRYNNKKIFLHVASECYVPFNVGIAYKKKFIFRNVFNNFILRAYQSGLFVKIIKDVEWEIIQDSGVKKASKANNIIIKIQFFIFFSQF